MTRRSGPLRLMTLKSAAIQGDLGSGAGGTVAQLQALDFTGVSQIPGNRREQRKAEQTLLDGGGSDAHEP